MLRNVVLLTIVTCFVGSLVAQEVSKSKSAAVPKTTVANEASASSSWKWLWHDAPNAGDAARLKTEFDVDTNAVSEAILQVTCDNGAKVYLNGVFVLSNRDWGVPVTEEVRKSLRVGKNELRAEAKNSGPIAGFIGKLTLKMKDGTTRVIPTDESWLATRAGSDEWKPARVVGNYGSRPWGDVFDQSGGANAKGSSKSKDDGIVTATSDIRTLPGFQVELLYTVPKSDQGSWVALTVDDQNRIIASDQYGGLYRLTPPKANAGAATVEKLDIEIQGAHGLLYAFNCLYVMVNEEPTTAGLWRLRDTKGNGQFDEKILLREIRGRNEHGNHSLALSPDRQSIYIACGNSTAMPHPLEHIRLPTPFADDQVLPRLSKGGDFSATEPHAFTCKVSPDGKRMEMVAAGMRNHFDIAFNALGDLFTYDSDMEWDSGTPWYRPTRVYHLVSGGDYGFRESSGKLLDYCPDIVPPVIDVGPGSPTGVVSGIGAKFPAKYQHAIFASDWTYGTLYAIHLTPEGAGYRGRLEEFISAKPLPLTDVVIGRDGAMYFAIGGRRTQSALYRVTYSGNESTATAPPIIETPEHKLRVALERLHDEGTGLAAIDEAFPHLSHPDRLVRYAARVAIERQPVLEWAQRALSQSEPWSMIEAGLALAHMGGKDQYTSLLQLLNRIEYANLTHPQHLALVRVYQIALARNGLPNGNDLVTTIKRLDALYPAKTNDLNRELSRTLVALGSASVVSKTMELLAVARDEEVSWLSTELLSRNNRYGPNFLRVGETRPNAQQIAFAYALRMAKNGWTPELREQYFRWFASASVWQGGNQFRGFLDEILEDSLENIPDATERKRLESLSKPTLVSSQPERITPPKGPGKNYTVDEVVAFSKDQLNHRDFARGREMYVVASCQTCHRLGNEGGGLGPDLTTASLRYTLRDLMENIIEPSKVISNQYESTIIQLDDGTILTGRLVAENDQSISIVTNPSRPNEVTKVSSNDIVNKKASPVSLMPTGLINSMNESEVKDLVAYILSAGDPNHAMFHP